MAVMGKKELSAKLAERVGISKKMSDAYLNTLLDTITEEIKNGNEIRLIGFGSFKIKNRAERTAVNPQTKEKITVPAKKTVVFKAGENLKNLS